MDGMGWIPVDVTPGFYYDTYALLQMAQVPGDIQRTAALEDSGEEVDAPDSLHAGKRPDSEVIDQLKTAVNILWGILLVVLLFKGIGIVLLEFRHLITERRLLGILELPPGDRAGMMLQAIRHSLCRGNVQNGVGIDKKLGFRSQCLPQHLQTLGIHVQRRATDLNFNP